MTKLLLAIPLLLLLAIPLSASASYQPTFESAIERAKQHLLDNRMRWLVEWAELEDITYKVDRRFVRGQGRADVWAVDKTIYLYPQFSGSKQDAALLVHEWIHVMDGPNCTQHPWSEERAYWWHYQALELLGANSDNIRARWLFYVNQPRGVEVCMK